jgi:hypothetical protein
MFLGNLSCKLKEAIFGAVTALVCPKAERVAAYSRLQSPYTNSYSSFPSTTSEERQPELLQQLE